MRRLLPFLVVVAGSPFAGCGPASPGNRASTTRTTHAAPRHATLGVARVKRISKLLYTDYLLPASKLRESCDPNGGAAEYWGCIEGYFQMSQRFATSTYDELEGMARDLDAGPCHDEIFALSSRVRTAAQLATAASAAVRSGDTQELTAQSLQYDQAAKSASAAYDRKLMDACL